MNRMNLHTVSFLGAFLRRYQSVKIYRWFAVYWSPVVFCCNETERVDTGEQRKTKNFQLNSDCAAGGNRIVRSRNSIITIITFSVRIFDLGSNCFGCYRQRNMYIGSAAADKFC